jgi:biotin carboxylase
MKKNILLFITNVPKNIAELLDEIEKKTGTKFTALIIRHKDRNPIKSKYSKKIVKDVIYCDLTKSTAIKKALLPYSEKIAAVISKGEVGVANLRKIIPHLPYISNPTESSIDWALDKLFMRQQLAAYNKEISPKFAVIKDDSGETLQKIKKKIGFPLVIKPTGLAASLLVSLCFHEEEFEKTIKKVFKKIRKIYKENKRTETPKILVEQFMEGEMYSIDAYVDSQGRISWCPFVHVKTGRSIGFDDFFGYQRITPTTMKESTQEDAKKVAAQSIYAIGLRNSTAHIELMRTDSGWKVIELGARMGGFRNQLYSLAFGINHPLNDVLIRLNEKPVIPKKKKGYSAALKFFAKEEGKLHILKGTKKLRKLNSFIDLKVHMKLGDKALFAKHGGKGVCDLVLFNKNRSELLADIRRAEEYMVIKTQKK